MACVIAAILFFVGLLMFILGVFALVIAPYGDLVSPDNMAKLMGIGIGCIIGSLYMAIEFHPVRKKRKQP